MSKKIKLSEEEIMKYVTDIYDKLKAGKFFDGGIHINENIPDCDDVATLKFSPIAYIKMRALVKDFETEVQWHGVVERIDKTTFLVKDILLFPHEVSSATVVSNQKEYEAWLDTLDDETFNHLRFHGHSHVRMAVNPSGTDMNYRKNVLQGISPQDDNAFYIFIIMNKEECISGEIYDLENNIIYSGKSDISFEIDGFDRTDFLENAHKLATKPVYTPVNTDNSKGKKSKHFQSSFYGSESGCLYSQGRDEDDDDPIFSNYKKY